MSTLRLDRLLADALGITRSAAQALCRAGRVSVGGVPALRAASHVDPERTAVAVDDAPLPARGPVVLLLHKPCGCVSATTDPDHPTVIDLVPAALRARGLAPAGRLDKDTTGLLILTNDGPLLHRLTHPRRHVAKTYDATLARPLPDDAAARVSAGLTLRDGTPLLPATLLLLPPDDAPSGATHRARIIIREGRYHQVRRMIAALGSHVLALHRAAIGELSLPSDLPPGACRVATREELELAMGGEERAVSGGESGR